MAVRPSPPHAIACLHRQAPPPRRLSPFLYLRSPSDTAGPRPHESPEGSGHWPVNERKTPEVPRTATAIDVLTPRGPSCRGCKRHFVSPKTPLHPPKTTFWTRSGPSSTRCKGHFRHPKTSTHAPYGAPGSLNTPFTASVQATSGVWDGVCARCSAAPGPIKRRLPTLSAVPRQEQLRD